MIKQKTTSSKQDHIAISASAGSGKTFQLANRYIGLLAGNIMPDRISALTFSRMAAGEIFDSIVNRLSTSAQSPVNAGLTASLIGMPDLQQKDFLAMLRVFLNNLHRMHIGTLDSFIVGVARAFPAELGIPVDFKIMDEDNIAANDIRQETLTRIFNPVFTDKNAQCKFLEAFKLATFGNEEKDVESKLDSFIDNLRRFFQLIPDKNAWGNQALIWHNNFPQPEKTSNPAQSAQKLSDWLNSTNYPGKMIDSMNNLIKFAGNYNEHTSWDTSIGNGTILERLLAHLEDLKKASFSLEYGRKEYKIDSEACVLLHQLMLHLVCTDLHKTIKQTQGLFQILEQYEAMYDITSRQTGNLTFTDAQHLLSPSGIQGTGTGLSRSPAADGRLYIDYRLDCKLDHWLLDEFQDTSDLQWAVLQNLIDEIIQDNSGQRSLFYVGDIKQAIYSWRGGNHRLFGNILKQYPHSIKQVPLSKSYRSCQPVIDTVNRVFGNLSHAGLPDGAVSEWRNSWQEHACEPDKVPGDGHVMFIEPQPDTDSNSRDNTACHLATASLLREIDPIRRGLSTAVLVRDNKTGKELADLLRSQCPDFVTIHEGKAAIKDNPVVQCLLALVQYAAHPGDTFAWQHLQMSPLGTCITSAGLNSENLTIAILKKIQTDGFQSLMREWGNRMDNSVHLDDFGKKRLEDLISAATEFDTGGNTDCSAFLRFIDNYQTHDLAVDNAVRVMTVHQAKGLGFDIVILPDLKSSKGMTSLRNEMMTGSSETSKWILKTPRRIIAEHDPVLSKEWKKAEAEACFDELCVLYVSLTRAKRALYMISLPPPKSTSSITHASVLRAQLCRESENNQKDITINNTRYTRLYESGNRDWYKAIALNKTPSAKKSQQISLREFASKPSRRKKLEYIEPSKQDEFECKASKLFDSKSGRTRDFGSAIHSLFEQIEWIEDADIENIIEKWLETSTDTAEVKRDVCEQFRTSVQKAGIKAALSKPASSGIVNLWREKKFEIIKDGKIISGMFDRITIIRDISGAPSQAVIIDYKSNIIQTDEQITAAIEKYRDQMFLYRQALSYILQLPEKMISCQIIFTHPGQTQQVHIT